MGPRILIAIAAGVALAACSVEQHRVQQPATVAVAPAPASTVVYTEPAAAPAVTTVYTR